MDRRVRTTVLVRVLAGLSLVPLLLSELLLWRATETKPGGAISGRAQDIAWLNPVLAVLVAALYLSYWLIIWPDRRAIGTEALLVAGMVGLATGSELVFGPSNNMWLFVMIIAGCSLRPRWAVPAILVMAVVATAPLLLLHHPAPEPPTTSSAGPGQPPGDAPRPLPGVAVPGLSVQLSAATITALPLLVAGLGATLVTFLVSVNRQLRTTRLTQAQLAVHEERVRVARDLHDVLGHNLSLMAVKLQVAEHLIGTGDPHATAEVRDVRRLTLDALRDVRETVSGYRQPTLDAELAGAGIALGAAEITVRLSDRHGVLTPEVEAACAWVIREATTNVIKHSRANTCAIAIDRVNGDVTVLITDDGAGRPASQDGTGLRGLRERVAALGGTLVAEPVAPGKGFQLSVRIPVKPHGGRQ